MTSLLRGAASHPGYTVWSAPNEPDGRSLQPFARAAAIGMAVLRSLWQVIWLRTCGVRGSIEEYERRWRRLAACPDALSEMRIQRSHSSGIRSSVLVNGRVLSCNLDEFFAWRSAMSARLIVERMGAGDVVVEVGAGAGKTVAALLRGGADRVVALEPTASGVALIRQRFVGCPELIGVERWNALSPQLPLQVTPGSVVVTHHVMEQLRDCEAEALENILRMRPRKVIHIEPCPEFFFQDGRLVGVASWLHWRIRRYQGGLLSELRRREVDGEIRISRIMPLRYSAGIRNAPSLIEWEPMNCSRPTEI